MDAREVPISLKHVNLKLRIGQLLFDILADQTLLALEVPRAQAMHNHSAYELQLIMSGSGTLLAADQEARIEAGSMFLIAPNVFHAIKPDKNSIVAHSTFQFTFHTGAQQDPWFPATETSQIEQSLTSVTFHMLARQEAEGIRMIMQTIQQELTARSFGVYTMVQGLLTEIMVRLTRSIQADRQTAYELPSKIKDDLRPRIIDRFYRQYKENLTIDMLAGQLNLSAKQVNRMLQQEYRTTFKQKLIDTRVEVAKDLLRASPMTIQQVSEEVGYANAENFCRVFVKKTGLTPSEYRKRHASPSRQDY